jgi:thioredoxin 1
MIELTEDNFDSYTQDKDLVVLEFWAQWCGPCKAFSPIFAEAAKRYPEVIFGKIDTEKQPELARSFEIRAIPTIMIMRNNVIVFLEASTMPLSALCELIEKAKQLDMSTLIQ